MQPRSRGSRPRPSDRPQEGSRPCTVQLWRSVLSIEPPFPGDRSRGEAAASEPDPPPVRGAHAQRGPLSPAQCSRARTHSLPGPGPRTRVGTRALGGGRGCGGVPGALEGGGGGGEEEEEEAAAAASPSSGLALALALALRLGRAPRG